MNILAIGDVVGAPGCEMLRRRLPGLKKFYGVDLCVVNGENSAEGNGITPQSLDSILNAGADVVTTGNHGLRRREVYDRFEDGYTPLLRPDNYGARAPGSGLYVFHKGRHRIAVINLIGTMYLTGGDNPFDAADRLLERTQDCRIRLVDFHAEATSEKLALAHYLDGRVTAVFGTHTHVQTSDARVLPGGTGYITDLGMTGPEHSILGVAADVVIARMRDNLQERFRTADGPCKLNGCVFTVDDATGKTTNAEAVEIR